MLVFKEKMTLKMDLKNKQYSDRFGLQKKGDPNGRKLSRDMWDRKVGEQRRYSFSPVTQQRGAMQLEKCIAF